MVKTLAIFGSTGLTGLCATEAALKKGFKVRALIRDASKAPEQFKEKLEIIQGNVLNYEDVLNTIKGADAVIVTLGTRSDLKPTTDLSEGLKNIIKAMEEVKIDVVSVCLSAFLFFDFNSERIPARLKDITADHIRMYDALKSSNLKYTAVFPPHITDNAATGYLAEEGKYLGRTVSKYDLGQFLVDTLDKSENYGKVFGLTSKP